MDIDALKTVNLPVTGLSNGVAKPENNINSNIGANAKKELQQPLTEAKNELSRNADKETVKEVSDALNKFFAVFDADLQFELHEKTHRLMVKLVDLKTNKVLKEFPPKEFLDTIASIQEYVGILLDKKA